MIPDDPCDDWSAHLGRSEAKAVRRDLEAEVREQISKLPPATRAYLSGRFRCS